MASNSTFAAQFPEEQFRDAIRNAMRMGMPENDADKLTWRWNRVKTFTPADPAGRPLHWDQPAVTDDPGNPTGDADDDGVIVDYAIEVNNISSQVDTSFTALGALNFQKIKVTLFDVDFAKVKTADYATIGNVRYEIRLEAPNYALFAVGMHDVFLEASDEE